MDTMANLRDMTINFIYALPGNVTDCILRLGFLLALATLSLFIALERLPWRNVLTQVCVLFLAIVVSVYIPVDEVRKMGKEPLAFLSIISVFIIIFLPNWLPYYLTPKVKNQMTIRGIIKKVLWIIIILDLLLGVRR